MMERRAASALAILLGATAASLAIAPGAAAFPLITAPGGDDSASSGTSTSGTGNAGASAGTAGSATDSTSGTAPAFDADQSALRHAIQAADSAGGALQPGSTAPAWIVTPSLGVQEVFNDNLYQTTTHRMSDAITVLTPAITITGDTPRIQVFLNYAPSLQYYAKNTSQNGLTQQLSLAGTVTLIPDTLYVDVRGAAGIQPTYGGVPGINLGAPATSGVGTAGPSNVLSVARDQTSQYTSFSISPYLVHRFGGTGTAKLGVSVGETASSAINNNAINSINGYQVPAGYNADNTSGHTFSTEEVAQFETGEDFGRFRDIALIDAYQSTGTGVSANAHNNIATNRLAYAITHQIAVYGELGYEDIAYSGTPAVRINDAIWGIGTILTPGPRSQITLGYGHQQGQNSVQFNGSFAVTPRTFLTASYQTGLGTDLQQVQDQLNVATIDQYGGFINAQTGGPLYLGNSLLGVQSNNLYQYKEFTFSATTTLDRDTLQLSVQYTDDTLAAIGSANGTGYSQAGTTASFLWLHQVSELTTVSAGASYSVLQLTGFQGQDGTDHIGALNATWQRKLSESVDLVAQYAFFDRVSTLPFRSAYQNVLILGITKRF